MIHHDILVPGFFFTSNGSRALTWLHPIEKQWLFGKWLEVHRKVVSWYVCTRTVGEGFGHDAPMENMIIVVYTVWIVYSST